MINEFFPKNVLLGYCKFTLHELEQKSQQLPQFYRHALFKFKREKKICCVKAVYGVCWFIINEIARML